MYMGHDFIEGIYLTRAIFYDHNLVLCMDLVTTNFKHGAG